MNELSNVGYNIVPTATIIELPAAPVTAPARPFHLFNVGLGWSIIMGVIVYYVNKEGNGFLLAAAGLCLSLSIAALGLVWGVFQHALRTIVSICRNAGK